MPKHHSQGLQLEGFRTAAGVVSWIRSDLLKQNVGNVSSQRYKPVEIEIMRQAMGTSIKILNIAQVYKNQFKKIVSNYSKKFLIQCQEIANELNAATGQDGFRTDKGV